MLFKKKKKSFACVPRLPHFLEFSDFLSKHSPPGLLLFTRWCQESFQSILSQEAKATKRVRLRLLKLHQAQKRTADTGDVRPKSSPDTTDETSVMTLNPYLCSTQRKIKIKNTFIYLNFLNYLILLWNWCLSKYSLKMIKLNSKFWIIRRWPQNKTRV